MSTTIDPRLTEWKHLHKLLHQALKENNFALRANVAKRIKELKPFYNEFSSAQPPTTNVEPQENDEDQTHMAFSFYTLSGSQRATTLCDRVYERWLKSRSLKRSLPASRQREYYQIIETIVANLLYCEASGHDGVRFSRDRKMYAAPSRYRPTVFNERFLSVIDELHSIGIVKQVKGDRLKSNPAQVFSKEPMKAYGLKQSFIVIGKNLELPFKPSMSDVNFITEGKEIIILKKGEGSQLLDYRDEDFPEAAKYRTQMQIINDMLDTAGDLLTHAAQAIHDQRRRYLTRRFTHASLESGGRLWDGFWLNGMKREERPVMIRLKGEPTVELDFSSMIVRLAYIVAEKPAPAGDQYAIPGLDPESRDGIKRVLATLLFDSSKNRDRFPKGVAKLFTPKDQAKGWKQVYTVIRTHHYELRAYLDRGLGHYLQFLESQVMVNVLLRCAMKSLVCLPIHDALVVPQSQAFRVRGIMGLTVRYMFGREASIPVTMKGLEEGEKRVA